MWDLLHIVLKMDRRVTLPSHTHTSASYIHDMGVYVSMYFYANAHVAGNYWEILWDCAFDMGVCHVLLFFISDFSVFYPFFVI